jgi:formyl-CoA transferase
MLTHVLADMGADVIKIEAPEGDSLRAWHLDGVSVQWKVYGRNKRSIALDLRDPGKLEILRRLVAGAHILVENFRPGGLEKLGLSPELLHSIQPGLVIVRISGWGQTGPYRDRPGFGSIVEAMSGYAFKNGFPDSPPLLPNVPLADSIAGIHAAAATLVALREVEVKGGRGQVIDVSLLEPILSVLGADQAVLQKTGKVPRRTGNRSSLAAPRNIYLTSDGDYLVLAASTPRMVTRLFAVIGRPELADDVRFSTNSTRVENALELDEIVQEFIDRRTLAENLAFFHHAGITVAPVYDAAQLMADEHVRARGVIANFPDEDLGSLPMHDVVPRLSRTPGAIRRPAPSLNEHEAEILAEIDAGDSLNKYPLNNG